MGLPWALQWADQPMGTRDCALAWALSLLPLSLSSPVIEGAVQAGWGPHSGHPTDPLSTHSKAWDLQEDAPPFTWSRTWTEIQENRETYKGNGFPGDGVAFRSPEQEGEEEVSDELGACG